MKNHKFTQRIDSLIFTFILGVFATGCAKEPSVKVAHGEDQNLFLKADLVEGPYNFTALTKPVSKLALAGQPTSPNNINFVIEEKNLHVYTIEDGIQKPSVVYEIIAHVDLVRERDSNGREGKFLKKSTKENLDWRKRAYIEVNPESYEVVTIAYGEDRNLYRKSDFPTGAVSPSSLKGSFARLVTKAKEDKVDLVSFELGKGILNIYKVVEGKNVPYLQFKIDGHYDLKQPKDDIGRLGVYLEKDNTTVAEWQNREFVEIDPYDVKIINLEIARSLKDFHLYDVATLDNGKFVLGKGVIPGVDQKLQAEISAKYGITSGTTLYSVLTQAKLFIKYIDASGAEVTVATVPVTYFDLKQAVNDDNEETHVHVPDQTEQTWEKRQYVMILPESAALETNDQKLIDKNLLSSCYSHDKIPFPEVRSAISPSDVGEKGVCFDLSQSYLSVFNGDKSHDNLLTVYQVVNHLDLVTRDDDLPSNSSTTWDKRRYVIISSNAPLEVKNLVEPNALSKKIFNGEFLYVTTVEKSHSEAGGSLIPGMRNVLEGRIKFELSENEITAYKTRETLNTNTKTPVLRFGARNFSIERVKNSFGDETSTIAETSDKEWNDESHVRVSFERNMIPGFFNEYFGLERIYFRRYIMSQSRMIGDIEIDKDGMITYYTEDVLTPDASSGFFGNGETVLEPKSVILRHTFMPARNNGYEPKSYAFDDFNKFGFFRTFEYKLDENGVPTDDTLFTYMNRYDLTDGKTVTFTVNEEFPEKYWDVAERAVAEWNKAFQRATGRTDDVILLKRNTGEKYTDPRVNMIAYIPDRIISGILGFGPMISDPETGKIYAAQTYLYDAVFKQVREHLDNIYDHVISSVPKDAGATALGGATTPEQAENIVNAMRTQLKPSIWAVAEQGGLMRDKIYVESAENAVAAAQNAPRSNISRTLKKLEDHNMGQVTYDLPQDLQEDFLADMTQTFQSMQKAPHEKLMNKPHCFYDAQNQISSAIKFIRLNKDKSKEEVLDILEKQSVYTTLLHELGHNFGLRHNFHGSFDEKNFSAEYHKLKEEIATSEEPASVETEERFLEMWKSTSVMDYIPSIEEHFTGLGPYDKAAILYGYGEAVEAKKSPFTQDPPAEGEYHIIPNDVIQALVKQVSEANPGAPLEAVQQLVNQTLEVKDYMFCTDDHVANDPTCNRHDTGVSMEEIVNNWISDYELNYLLYSERNNRRRFTGNSSFVMGRYFLPIRQVFDEFVYKLVTNSFGAETGPTSRQDFINAMITGMNFFTDLLETPEAGNYFFDEKEQKFVSGEAPNAEAKRLIVPEGMGKQLMATFSEVNGVDQATKRGHLFDKLFAMLSLTMRGYPAEKYQRASLTVNYYDFEVFRNDLFGTFSKMMKGSLEKETKAVLVPGAGVYLAVTDEVAQSLPDNMEVIDAKLDASANNIVEEYSMIFAVDDFNNDADQTFEDYVDFRVVGVDDQGIPAGVETLKFLNANGVQEYVVPQTLDGRSIAFSIAEDAPKIAEEYHEGVKFINDPANKEALETAIETAFPIVFEEFKKTWQKIQGEEMPENIVEILNNDKEAGIDQMLTLTNDVLTNAKNNLAAAETAGDEEAIARFKELVEFLEARLEPSNEASSEFKELKAKFDKIEESNFDLKTKLVNIESRLKKIKRYYGILN